MARGEPASPLTPDQQRKAIRALDDLCRDRKRAPSLKQLAAFINEWIPHLEATVRSTTVSTDRNIAGTRLRHPGRGRQGNELVVEIKGAKPGYYPFYSHNSAETYRHNGEAVEWVAKRIGHKHPYRFARRWTSW